MKKVIIDSNGLSIHGTLALPSSSAKPFPGVITFHGMTSSENGYLPLIARLAKAGIAGLAINMRGHGKNAGDFNKVTVSEAIADGLAAYDFLAARDEVDSNRIGLIGASVGAILAALTSSQRPVKSLLLRAPAAYTKDMMQLSMAETMTKEKTWFHEIENLEDTPAGHAITAFGGSLLVIASENDTIIPLSVSGGYIDIAKRTDNKRFTTIKEAGHALTESRWKESFHQAVMEWFTTTLKT